jgi:hypothetical protein
MDFNEHNYLQLAGLRQTRTVEHRIKLPLSMNSTSTIVPSFQKNQADQQYMGRAEKAVAQTPANKMSESTCCQDECEEHFHQNVTPFRRSTLPV